MAISQFDNIRVVLAEPKADLRKTLKTCLQGHGFRSVLDTGNLSQVASAVREGNVDLLIADTSLPEGDFNEYVTELRHGKHGDNPFLVVVTLVSNPSREAVQAAIDSGTDHVLAKPFQPDAMINHVLDLTHGRKRFVVTTDYIGPDRRSGPRPGGMEIPVVEVPNALRQRMTGQMSDSILRRAISAAKAKINEQKVVRHAYQIGWLLDRLLPELNAPEKSDAFKAHIVRLGKVADDISVRIKSTHYAHIAEMCMTLSSMVVEGTAKGFDENDIHLLNKIAVLIEATFDPERLEQGAAYLRNPEALRLRKDSDVKGAQFPAAAVV
jgi:CheY-like chemotaxis protein